MCEKDGYVRWLYVKEIFQSYLLTAFTRYPLIILFLISYVIIGLSYGISYLSVTVNPIEIWAAPNSRSRIEKDYFDNRFQPFYRTEQIFIKSVNLDWVRYF